MDEDISGYDKKPSWDVAVRYQDLKRLLSIPDKEKAKLKKRAVQGVLDRARRVLGSVLKPERSVTLDYREFQAAGGRGELDLSATFEEGLARGLSPGAFDAEALRFDARVEKDQDIALVMDASLSMTGEKIALLAVAAAVVALCVPSRRLALLAFASQAKVIKPFGEELALETLVERVLEIPTMGLTNLELALKESLKLVDAAGKAGANVILITDGKYTEGKDPTPLAARFKKLHALKLGRDIAGRALLQDLVRGGNGRLFEVRRMPDLPRVMYGAMKSLLR